MAETNTVGTPPVVVVPVTPPAEPVGIPKAVELAHRLEDQIAAIKADPDKMSWADAVTFVSELKGALEVSGGSLNDEQKREVSDVLVGARDEAKQANKWSFWEVVGAIFLLGIPGIVDALVDYDHEKVSDQLEVLADPKRVSRVKENTDWALEALKPGQSGTGNTAQVKKINGQDGEVGAALKPAEIKKLSLAERAAVARHVEDDASNKEQITFMRNLLASDASKVADNARILSAFDADLVAQAVRPSDIASADDKTKFFITTLITTNGDHEDMRNYANANKSVLDKDSRSSLVLRLLDGHTKEADENAIVGLLFPKDGDTKTAEAVLAGFDLERLAQIKDDIDADGASDKLKDSMYKLYANCENKDLRVALVRAGYSTH